MTRPRARAEESAEETPTKRTREYTRLFASLDHAIDTLASDSKLEDALRESFDAAVDGFGAKKALVLLVQSTDPLRMKNLVSKGLSIPQVEACEQGRSVPKVSSSMIREAVHAKEARVREDPRLEREEEQTGSTAEGGYSALCAPILDPLNNNVLAVAYFQHTEATESYDDSDLAFLSSYAKALGRVFAVLLRERNRRQAAEEGGRTASAEIKGDSSQTQQLRTLLIERYIQVANVPRPWPIYIRGERGVGKELVAKFLHEYSDRRKQPYVVVNCSSLTKETAEARLFGSKRGAYTSSVNDELGFFRAANKGVLFLDEIGQLDLDVQATLLRVLENRTVKPMGESMDIPVDVLVILATNKDLDEAVKNKEFLPDLYDRFRVHKIDLLPLRSRPADIPALVEYFRDAAEKRYSKRLLGFSPEAMRAMIAYRWPGNVREVERIVDFLVVCAKPGGRIDRDLLAAECPDILNPENIISRQDPIGLPDDIPYEDAINLFRRDFLFARFEQNQWITAATAKSLGLSESTVLRYQKELEIWKPNTPRPASEEA